MANEIYFILFLIIHIILNFKWIKHITKNLKKVKRQIKVLYIVDVMVFVVYFITIGLGLITSSIFNFKISSSLKMMLSHYIFGRLALIFMLIHIGFHLKTLIIGLLVVGTFVLIVIDANENVMKWIWTLLLSIVFIIMGIIGIISYNKDKKN